MAKRKNQDQNFNKMLTVTSQPNHLAHKIHTSQHMLNRNQLSGLLLTKKWNLTLSYKHHMRLRLLNHQTLISQLIQESNQNYLTPL